MNEFYQQQLQQLRIAYASGNGSDFWLNFEGVKIPLKVSNIAEAVDISVRVNAVVDSYFHLHVKDTLKRRSSD